MKELDEKLRRMAREEDTPVPDGFDERLAARLAALPGGRRRLSRGVRAALIAACLCVAVVGTTVAVSPPLRERLAEILGTFQPYAQEMEGVSYVSDGIEVTVLSAMADGGMVRVYAQVRDLEGDRLSSDMRVSGTINRVDEYAGDGVIGGTFSAECVGYDGEVGAALLDFCTWGPFSTDIPDMELVVNGFCMAGDTTYFGGGAVPLHIEVLERRSFQAYAKLNGVELEAFEVSPMGLAATTKGEDYPPAQTCVYLEDGTAVKMESWRGGGTVTEGWSTGELEYGRQTYWSFPDAVDIDAVIGVSFGAWYIPVNPDGAVGEGRWLSN